MSAILNVGDSDKDAQDIGTFGIGFKIIHRLLGEDDGLKAILNDYAGPIVFSWNQYNHLRRLLDDEDISVNRIAEKDEGCPWLLKIIYTCFPTHPGEVIKDENFKSKTLFPIQQLQEFRYFLKTSLAKLDTFTENNLKQGSIFFLRIGADKFKYIDENIENISKGIGYSFNFLNNLKRIYINEQEINKEKIELKSFKYPIGSDQYNFIKPRIEERAIEFAFTYQINYLDAIKLKSVPNIFNFFSMEEEINGFCFIVHCNSFDMHNDRRKLQPNSNINERLLPTMAEGIKNFLEDLAINHRNKYLSIFPSLLLSDIPTEKPHIHKFFYAPLATLLQEKIPTENGLANNYEKVAIKKTKLSVSPTAWGIDKNWFYWSDFDGEQQIIAEAQNPEKIGLDTMTISSLIENGRIEYINDWILNANDEDLSVLLDELNGDIPSINFFNLKFVKLSDGLYYSIDEIVDSKNLICVFDEIADVTEILNKIGLATSFVNFSKYKNISEKASSKIKYLHVLYQSEIFENFVKESTIDNSLNPDEKKRIFVSVKNLHNVNDKLLTEWYLFTDTSNRITPLERLITASASVENWLRRYQLNENEFFPELEDYLIPKEQVYSSIIFHEWESIIERISFDAESIGKFYDSVMGYFDPEKDKAIVLNDKAYIFTGNGFTKLKEVYFHEKLSSIPNYMLLQSAIEKMSGLCTPVRYILSKLLNEPFRTQNDNFIEYIKSTKLRPEEAHVILEFCQQAEVKIFNKGVFNEINGEILWECSSSKKQYYTDDKSLISFINEHLCQFLFVLPKHLHEFKSYEGILRNLELYEEIIYRLGDNVYEIASELFPLLKHKDLTKRYIKSLPEIKISNKSTFSKGSYEYLIISFIVSEFDDTELIQVRDKLMFEHEDQSFSLNEIVTGNDVQFKIETKKYLVKISGILPDSFNYAKASEVERIMEIFRKLEFPKTKIENLFSIQTEHDNIAEQISNELIEIIDDGLLITAEQVAFCLLYEVEFGWENFDVFQIFATNGEKYKLNETWYLNDYSFVSLVGAVTKQYRGLGKILKINDERPIFKVSEKCIFLFKPAFDEDGSFIASYFDENLSDSACVNLFNFLYSEYLKRGKDSKRDFENVDSWSKFGETESEKIIGFDPELVILTDETDLIIDIETPPYWLKEWADIEEKIEFLKAIRIQTKDTEIINLRKSLLYEDIQTSPEQIVKSDSLSEMHLKNTLKWMIESESWSGIVLKKLAKVSLLNSVITKLGQDPDDFWLVDEEKLSNKSSEWDDKGYLKWVKNQESFKIYLFKGKMPYNFEYSDYVLAQKKENDYWYDDANAILYVNQNISIQLSLQQGAKDGNYDIDQIQPLLEAGLARVSELEKRLQELENENIQLRQKPDLPTKRTDGISIEGQMNANLEARRAVKNYLKSKSADGYDVSTWDPDLGNSMVINSVFKNGEPINIVVKSAIWGEIYLAANEFDLLCQDNKNQLFVYNGMNVKTATLASIFASNNLIQLQLDTENIPPNVLAQLAKAFKYLSNTKFVVADPNHSRNALFHSIGMDNLNEGFISAGSDDEF